jgi:hypothetical protein
MYVSVDIVFKTITIGSTENIVPVLTVGFFIGLPERDGKKVRTYIYISNWLCNICDFAEQMENWCTPISVDNQYE